MSQKAIFPGTFDPITSGHVDLVQRAARRFDAVVVSVAGSGSKSPCFTLDERIDLARQALSDCNNVQVKGFEGLVVRFAREEQAGVMLRGLRTMSDFEYEFQLANMNRQLAPEVETMFLTPAEGFTSISSSLVREIARLGGDVSAFVPTVVERALHVRFS
jgi:pantetheine-phosphate adenylyltransferase